MKKPHGKGQTLSLGTKQRNTTAQTIWKKKIKIPFLKDLEIEESSYPLPYEVSSLGTQLFRDKKNRHSCKFYPYLNKCLKSNTL